jgi:hypothetical protein
MPNRIPTPGIPTPPVRKSNAAQNPAKPMPTPTATSQIKNPVNSYTSGWKTGMFGKDAYSYNKQGKIVKGVKGLPKAGGE